MTGIKVVLISAFLGVLIWAFRNRARVGLRASVRLLALALTTLAIVSVLVPGITQWLADRVGVTRGTDLVFYLFIVVMVITSVVTYFRFLDVERRLVEIVRAQAIRDAVLAEGLPGRAQNGDKG